VIQFLAEPTAAVLAAIDTQPPTPPADDLSQAVAVH